MAKELIKKYTAGDTVPDFTRTAPTAQVPGGDLTGFTVRLKIERPDGVTIVKEITTTLTADGHIDDPTNLKFFFRFVAADLIAGDLQDGEIEYDDGAGGISTERDLVFSVAPQL